MKHPHAYRIAIYLFIHLYIHAVPALSQQPASSHASATPDPAFQGEASLEAINLFMDGIRQDLLHERYEKLEALARTLRTSKARFPGGTWKLKVFYHATTRPVSKGKVSEAEWNLFFPRLRKWEAKFPHSITPQVAMAGAYVEYAWSARGNGYAYRVTEEGYNLFRARLIQAKKVLLESESLPEKCPEWFWTMLSIAKGEGWEWAEYEELFEDAIALEPAYQYFYTAKAVYLLPRWGGQSGEAGKFADEVMRQIPGEDGKILYYFIAEEVASYETLKTFYVMSFSWDRTREGFYELEKKYGMNLARRNEFARMAGWANDQKTAMDMLERIGTQWDSDVWYKEETFIEFKAWADGSSWTYFLLQYWMVPIMILVLIALIAYRVWKRQARRQTEMFAANAVKPFEKDLS